MYSLQHVFWRGAMALSLLVLGGVGAGVSEAPRETARACPTVEAAVQARVLRDSTWHDPTSHDAAWREVALLQRSRERRVRGVA